MIDYFPLLIPDRHTGPHKWKILRNNDNGESDARIDFGESGH